jgi:hypothetical protein
MTLKSCPSSSASFAVGHEQHLTSDHPRLKQRLLVYLKECIDTIQKYKDMKFENIVEGRVTASALK